MSPSLETRDAPANWVSQALQRAADFLLRKQHVQGYWCAELTADTTLESDYILLQLWLYPPQDGVWSPPSRPLIERAARAILERQLPDGGFNIYPQGPAEVSATVKAYFALKLAGLSPGDAHLDRARDRILSLGGVQAANSYVKINLSLFDLYPRAHAPRVPPELMLLGNLVYEMSSWTRAIVIPLSIVQGSNVGRPAPAGFTLEELFLPGRSLSFRKPGDRLLSWRTFFLALDRGLRLWERFGVKAIRRRAIRAAERWMLDRTRYSDGLGAIYPPMMYIIMALDVLGYRRDHPDFVEAMAQFERLIVQDGDRFFFQPCFSPLWDTGIAAYALGESGAAPPEALQRAADWILSKEVRRKGDWSIKRPTTEPSGWYFEFANEFYPDIDDTAMILLALRHAHATNPGAQKAAAKRALNWLLSMQSKDGGWAAFDVDNNWDFLSHVPFADHNAMLDPACPDITGRVLEALAQELPGGHPAVRRGVEYLVRRQQPDGSWYGRWGVNYIYGTCFALRGLRAAGEDPREAYVLRGGEWLRAIQNADGGWGESCASYDNETFTPAPSTPSQTAWALLGLMAGGDNNSLSVRKGIQYLLARQRQDGSWHEETATGTGFPKVFYLTYHLYRQYFPLLALASFGRAADGAQRPGPPAITEERL
jgi:squalene-hopene/tetraprenyl-beta-curcumene cyclase